MSGREVTELDFRAPEYLNAKVEDYEFRQDGKLVRKDRWEMAVNHIRELVGMREREFEINDVVTAVENLVNGVSVKRLDAALDALQSIDVYGSDTIAGPSEGTPDDRKWYRDAVIEMTKRARVAISGEAGAQS